jgi:hypothetical protein
MNMSYFAGCVNYGDSHDILKRIRENDPEVLRYFVKRMKSAQDVLGELDMRAKFILTQAESEIDLHDKLEAIKARQ